MGQVPSQQVTARPIPRRAVFRKALRPRPDLLADGASGAVSAERTHDMPHVRDADVEPARHGNRLVICHVRWQRIGVTR